jgi:hypothetical protein
MILQRNDIDGYQTAGLTPAALGSPARNGPHDDTGSTVTDYDSSASLDGMIMASF